jgi:hypothetical protein
MAGARAAVIEVRRENAHPTISRGKMAELVMPGLDPGIHQSSLEHFPEGMDCRVEPGNDDLLPRRALR